MGSLMEWLSLAAGIAFLVTILFVPGFLLLAPTKFESAVKIACAPIVSVFLFSALALAFAMMRLRIPGVAYAVLMLIVGGTCSAAHYAICLRNAKEPKNQPTFHLEKNRKKLTVLLLYFLFNTTITSVIFVSSIDGAGSFAQEYDNYAHLNSVRELVDSGFFFNLNLGIYPQAWHGLSALCSSVIGCEPPIAINALVFATLAFVFPAATFTLIEMVWPNDTRSQISGALLALSSVAFPWGFVFFGPLYPNLLGYAVLPMAAYILSTIFQAEATAGARVARSFFFLLCIVSLFFSHQSALFVGVVFMAPYCCSLIYRQPISRIVDARKNLLCRLGLCATFCIFVVGIWCILYKTPALYGTVHFTWPAFQDVPHAFAALLAMALPKDLNVFRPSLVPQLMLALFVLIGILRCLKRKQNIWLVASYAIAGTMYVINTSLDGTLKQVLTGFWYTDSYRIAALVAIIALPLAAYGMAGIYQAATKLAVKPRWTRNRQRATSIAVAIVAGAVFASVNYLPLDNSKQAAGNLSLGFTGTPFGIVVGMLESSYNLAPSENILDADELAFCNKAIDLISDEQAVINVPYDGSIFAYGATGLDVRYHTTWFDFPTDINAAGDADSVIRKSLSDIESDESVMEAVDAINAGYVLLLDQNNTAPNATYVPGDKHPEWWEGITSINDDTPGFEILLAEDDMRLYKINHQ